MLSNIIAECMGIARSHFLNTPYKEQTTIEMYALDGFANKATGICHYCTIDTLKAILNKESLRFSDVWFLNDSAEFVEILRWIENLITNNSFNADFQRLILESDEMTELKEYRQSYIGVSNITHQYQSKIYRTYTCSFSTDINALSMWNYYAQSAEGVNISFDHSWNMFDGSNRSEVNIGEKLENGIIIYWGLVIYKNEEKKKCIIKLLNRLQEVYDEAKDDIKKYQGYILFAFKQAVNNMRCFFKNENFESENEYRIVLRIPEELLLRKECLGDIVEKGQFKRGNILIPYVDYKFRKSSVKRIVINPYIKDKSDIFELGIKELLWMNQMEDIHIVHSDIPVRKYSS